MANTKISALTALAGASVDTAADVLALVDTSVTTTKKIVVSELGIALGLALKAPLASPTFTGTPVAPTAAVDTNTTQIASTAFVIAQISADSLSGITLGTEQASTSGTSIDFTSLPAGVKRITVMLIGASTNGISDILFQLGDAGGPEATGYACVCVGSAADNSFTTGFGIVVSNATDTHSGVITFTLENASTFTWAAHGGFSVIGAPTAGLSVSGYKSLSAELDRVRITTVGGTDTFDLGSINISYES